LTTPQAPPSLRGATWNDNKRRCSRPLAFGALVTGLLGAGLGAAPAAFAASKPGRRAGCSALFEAGMHSEAVRRLSLRGALQRALEREEFVLLYQPLVDLDTGRVRDAEALLRWNHPEHGLTPPEEFIALAEETGVIVPIGRWVLQTAARQLARWQRTVAQAEDVHVSVNLSARQLSAPGLLDDVARTLSGTGLHPATLVLEITESVLMDDFQTALRTLSGLKSLGVGLALDDFGTGYRLTVLPAGVPDRRAQAVQAVRGRPRQRGRSRPRRRHRGARRAVLRMRTVAEGIETPQQADHLRELGYDVGQGYHFARPMTADSFALLVAEQPFLRPPLPLLAPELPEQPVRLSVVR